LRQIERDAHGRLIMVRHRPDPSPRQSRGQASDHDAGGGERVARVLARAGVASRREAERLIEAGRIALNGQALSSPAINVGAGDILTLDGKPVAEREPARLWRYHKPPGLITTHKDPKGRPTVFERLPPGLPRVISVGRLDLSTEGLLLLTNDGELARQLELPSTGLVRRYRARAFGRVSQEKLDRLKDGITVDGVAYGAIQAHLDGGKGANLWITLELAEGKNREVRRVLEAIGLKVNRLIRVNYGPFELGDLEPGAVHEVPKGQVKKVLEGELAPAPAKPFVRSTPSKKRDGSADKRASPARTRTAKAKTAEPAPKLTYKPGWARPKRKPTPKPGTGRRRPKS
jgi:23S rRNA pseudouridine2605 synthase